MAILFPNGFEIVSKEPIDNRLVVSFEQMLDPELNTRMPVEYASLCIDNHKLYVYSEDNEFIDVPTEKEIGKFRLLDVDYAEWGRLVGDIEEQTDLINKINLTVEEARIELQNNINIEQNRAITAENLIRNMLDSEIGRATNVENVLRRDLQDEISRASEAENTLDSKLDTQVELLTNKINSEKARAEAAESNLSSKLDAEVSARKAADTALSGRLDAEISRATARENQINNDLISEVSRATSVETEIDNRLTARIAAEESRSLNKDNELTQSLASEVERATQRENSIESNLNSEISNREQGDNTLTTNLNKEIQDRESAISDVNSKLDTEISDRENADSALEQAISTETSRAEEAESGLDVRLLEAESDIETIEGKIPSEASSTNQLADKDFVNSSIATNTAYFVGTFDSVEELKAVENPTNNDYGYVKIVDEITGLVKEYDRWKFNADENEWKFEYPLNNSSFTAEQWAAITSGITSLSVEQIRINETNIGALELEKVDKVQGKELSTNDYTNEDKLKLTGIEAGANKTIVDSDLKDDSTNPVQNKIIKSALDGKSNIGHKHTKSDITDFPNLATVATSGSYNDLINKPDIPSKVSDLENDLNFGTISEIKMNGVSKGTTGVVDLGTVITDVSNKQDLLVSNQNIKTINNQSVLGPGNIQIDGAIYTEGSGINISEDNVISVSSTIATKTDLEAKANKSTTLSGYGITDAYTKTTVASLLNEKQETLVSGTNIKTINGNSILGSGNLLIEGGGDIYTPGDGINIDEDGVISVNDTIARKSNLGTQLTIEVEDKTLKIRTI